MDIQHTYNNEQGEFFLLNETGAKIAKLSYYFVDKHTINANHTFVDPSLRGQGIADKLYQALSDFVQQKQLDLIPSCHYIATKWQKERSKN
ncbi:GNAT family N-acetyltransferase [Conservatibacter flavescens]|uniref:GNAT family N-acetyltransferase n=1 Tax=Conservatibacter flavescens TaxID=28161 RepID=A0A2M8S069_9PAST|nr:GNAT family N-acetyltransferase [Conservatibacter flavescens]PJG84525.1 GNAT family N-acetyltransferase [Conservatibacter flavescens]